ncbi:uncharacterized protein F5891DRAFT_977098 [Suillus fuscotomentosus]|uniref:Uncharacterized protein n=1 Tax=Suillus fuscotomentosus TaxID=1912939 RepID=A0AAD4HPI1_9AGAM|nr:uncharacterized protein F5891DRAFT_977098 [Suillus fuscotomentosus]KAG1904213.1 hypothetical protein F5891DRAFT_977098 [Suillus fuscotomentosus]
MARLTFLQKVLRRPSQKLQAQAAHHQLQKPLNVKSSLTRDFYSTKGKLLHKSCAFKQNGRVVLTAATALNFGRQASGVSIAADVHSRKLQAPRQETIWESHASADQSIDPSQHDSEEVFYTSPSSPISSPPAHFPYSTPFHFAASSTATLGFDNPQFISVSTTSLIESSLSTTVTMIPIKNEPGCHKRIPNHWLEVVGLEEFDLGDLILTSSSSAFRCRCRSR